MCLNECIAKRHLTYSNPIQKNVKKGGRALSLSFGEIDEIFDKYFGYPQHGSYSGNTLIEFKERIAYGIFNSAEVI